MPSEPEELRRLLKDAHGEIEQLRSESDEYMNAISDLVDGQNALEMQVLQMNEQIAELEGMLKISDSELADAMIGLSALQEAFQKLRSTAASTLETARSATSRVQMAASMYELASSTEMADEVEIVDVSRQQMADLRNRLRR